MGRFAIGKFSSARAVWMPQYASAGISRDPRESVSVRVRVIASRAMVLVLLGLVTAVWERLNPTRGHGAAPVYAGYTRRTAVYIASIARACARRLRDAPRA